jgi:ZIP family zinc transporter
MLQFVLILLATAGAQVFGGILSWFLVKNFCRNLRTAVLAEIIIMFLISTMLIGEGLRITLLSVVSVFIGIIAIGVLNKTIPHRHETRAEKLGFMVFIAMCFHEFPEGVAFGAAYLVNPAFGVLTGIMIALHNLPEGSIVSLPYFMKKKFVRGLGAVMVTQLLYIIGGIAAYSLMLNVPVELQAVSMTFAAGAMLYLITEEFLWVRCMND